MTAGFLTVLGHPEMLASSPNPNYRGIDRMLPIDMNALAAGQSWPTLDLDFVDEDLLAPDLASALVLRDEFEKLRPGTPFEIIYVRSVEETDPLRPPEAVSLLGYDVASPAPFYSIVGDIDPTNPVMMGITPRLNAAGLLSTRKDAADYLENSLEAHVGGADETFKVWEIWDAAASDHVIGT